MGVAIYILNSGTNCDDRNVFFTGQIRSLLSDESIDFEQASDRLVELRDILEELREAVTTNNRHSLGAVEMNLRCVRTLAHESNSDKVHKGPLLGPVLEVRRSISTVSVG